MSYMLAIEPHQKQAGILRESVGAETRTKLTVVGSMDAAMSAINAQVPRLVLLSALIPPHEESQLVARLRNLPQASAPEILMIPELDGASAARPSQSLFDRFRGRKPLTGCDPSAFARQLSAYLRRAKPAPSSEYPAPSEAAGSDRRAAARIERVDWASVLINGTAVSLVDLSSTGAQILASMVLMPRGSVDVTVLREGDIVRCEAGIVWGGFEIAGQAQMPWYRAGINFKDTDRDALERLLCERAASSNHGPRRTENSTALVLRSSSINAEVRQPAPAEPREPVSIIRTPVDRSPRAARRNSGEMSWYTSVRLPWGLELRLINISSTGLLLESGCRLEPGRVTELRLCGPKHELVVAANIVRSEVAQVTELGVKYHVAATFERPLEFPELRPGARATPPPAKTLSRLLAQASADLDRAPRTSRRAALERSLRRVVPAREIQIRDEPFTATNASVAMSFSASSTTATTGGAGSPVVQALFDRGSEPTEVECKLLRAAAGLAALVFEFDGNL